MWYIQTIIRTKAEIKKRLNETERNKDTKKQTKQSSKENKLAAKYIKEKKQQDTNKVCLIKRKVH